MGVGVTAVTAAMACWNCLIVRHGHTGGGSTDCVLRSRLRALASPCALSS